MDTGPGSAPAWSRTWQLLPAVNLRGWLPTWSVPAAMRAVRAAIVVPGMFALTDKVIGNVQMATFAAFGGFATLVLANFGGTRRDKLIAHFWLAVVGSVMLTIGTAVSSSTVLAVIVTVPLTFAVFFGGIAGPNAASGAIAALLPYVLPAASPGTFSMVPDRLAGWWLASIAGTALVLLLSPPTGSDMLRGATSRLAAALADQLDAVLAGEADEAQLASSIAAKHELFSQFTGTPFRPTGLARSDQALANAVELLEWCTSLLLDTVREGDSLSDADPVERELFAASGAVLRDASSLFLDARGAQPDLERLERSRRQSLARLHGVDPESPGFASEARLSFHANAIAVTSLLIGGDALLAAGLADPEWVAEARIRWFGGASLGSARRLAAASRYAGLAVRHTSLRSVWFINSMRGALALALAVAVADLTGVQHGFWVVLGTLSVLRTSAAATGATALRALTGTAIGFAIGAALLLGIGSDTTVLWITLPIAVFVAAYAPGTAPLAVGQAAFTVTIAVLFNLLVPVGWRVGVVRIEDVALGCAVSVVVGMLFWPRGVASLVADDLADAFRAGAAYLSQAVQWVCGQRGGQPDAGVNAVTAGLRLDEALRGFLAEQGTKHIAREELWRLVGGTLRLRLTAHAVAGLPHDCATDPSSQPGELDRRAELLGGWYERLAYTLSRPAAADVAQLPTPNFDGEGVGSSFDGDSVGEESRSHQVIWLSEHLDHLAEHLDELVGPAAHVAQIRRQAWWR